MNAPDRRQQLESVLAEMAPDLKDEERTWILTVCANLMKDADGERKWMRAAGERILELTEHPSVSDLARVRRIAQQMAEATPANFTALAGVRLAEALAHSRTSLGKYRLGRKRGRYGALKTALREYIRPGRSRQQVLARFERDAEAVDGDVICWHDNSGIKQHHTRKTVANAISSLLARSGD